jgi:hypothetical protein
MFRTNTPQKIQKSNKHQLRRVSTINGFLRDIGGIGEKEQEGSSLDLQEASSV